MSVPINKRKEALRYMFHIFNPLGKEDFFSPNVSLKNLQAFKPYLADTVYQLKSPPFPREAIFVSMLAHTHKKKKNE